MADEKTDTSKLSVFRADEDWVIAESENEARTILKEFLDLDYQDIDDLAIEKLSNDKLLKIRTENESGEITVEKTVAEWIVSNGKGYLCGYNF